MKLRELINRLEELSEDGKYDETDILTDNFDEILDIHCVSDKFFTFITV